MSVTSLILEQVLKRLQLPENSISQFQIVSSLSDVDGKGFPKELFLLSAPVIVRGLLNFAMLQMNSDWIYPFWVHKQLDPKSESYVARAQNPLLINITHRNWTALGTLEGFHEAIVDPRGLITPLPREWSVDTWLVIDDKVFYPSLSNDVNQKIDSMFPHLTTSFHFHGADLRNETFIGTTNHNLDILFSKSTVQNKTQEKKTGFIGVAIRPFNPEGVAPINKIECKTSRIVFVNNAIGVVFEKTPDWISCSSYNEGDLSQLVIKKRNEIVKQKVNSFAKCDRGLAHAVAIYSFDLNPDETKSVHFSIALAEEKNLRSRPLKQTWRVGFDKRKLAQRIKWEKEISTAATIKIADSELQKIMEANRLTLLQFNDNDFISPGAYLYHHFWYRDAVMMIRALDVLGFHSRAQRVIDAFPKRLKSNGFFCGPDGEWDSNGEVIWTVFQHFLLTKSITWLKHWYPMLDRGAKWIIRMRKKSSNGLMPRSLSAEHLGTVDQYYWDSFWSLAGLKAMIEISRILKKESESYIFEEHARAFETDILKTFERLTERLGEPLIPATPFRTFDESAIGSICSVYPLHLFDSSIMHPRNTVQTLQQKYVDEKGFFHPIIHSGYNPYLTIQIAHSLLWLGEIKSAWEVADTIFKQVSSPYSLPEAIHPRTGCGSMGDGHHGWAAAEIILFLRDCLVHEENNTLILFKSANDRFIKRDIDLIMKNVPTLFGTISCSLIFEEEKRGVFTFSNNFHSDLMPEAIEIYLPFSVRQIVSSRQNQIEIERITTTSTYLRCNPDLSTLLFEL